MADVLSGPTKMLFDTLAWPPGAWRLAIRHADGWRHTLTLVKHPEGAAAAPQTRGAAADAGPGRTAAPVYRDGLGRVLPDEERLMRERAQALLAERLTHRISYDGNGRAGTYTWAEGERRVRFDQEMGASPCRAWVRVPAAACWEVETGMPLARRDEVLQRLADAGTARMDLTGGTQLQSTTAVLGERTGSTARVLVAGSDTATTRWTNTQRFVVGKGGRGELTLTCRAALVTGPASLGSNGGSGLVVMDNSGPNLPSWTVNGSLAVGEGGGGAITLADGMLSSGAARIGTTASGSGSVTVGSPQANWTIGGDLTIGGTDTGRIGGLLVVNQGGVVRSSGTALIQPNGVLTLASQSLVSVGDLGPNVGGTGQFTGQVRFLQTFEPQPGVVAQTMQLADTATLLLSGLGGTALRRAPLQVTEMASLGGTLGQRLDGSFLVPAEGAVLDLIGWGQFSGTFASFTVAGLDPAFTARLRYDNDALRLNITAVPEPATWLFMLMGVAALLARRRGAGRG